MAHPHRRAPRRRDPAIVFGADTHTGRPIDTAPDIEMLLAIWLRLMNMPGRPRTWASNMQGLLDLRGR